MREKIREIAAGLFPEAAAMFCIAKSAKAQGSLEYIMMLAAASIVVVVALAMVVKLRSAVVTSVSLNGSNVSIANAISSQLSSLNAH
jgi:hypothetical protein